MLTRFFKVLLPLAGVAALAGCSTLSTRALPKADIGHYKRIFVERRLADGYGVAAEITRQLNAMGYDATTGALTMMPTDTELIVSYEDMWTWDFDTYMIEIDISVRSARSDRVLAVGHYVRPGLVFARPPASMIHDLLAKLFKQA
jgi:hypothetical protein